VEGILVLKALTDTLSPGSVLDSIQTSLMEEGYINAKVSIQELFIKNDTLVMILNIRKGFPFISRHVKISGYFASFLSYRVLARDFENRIVRMKTLEDRLNMLDRFFGNKSKIIIGGDSLIIGNEGTPRIRGAIFISDSIKGSLEAKWDGIEVYYSPRKSILSITMGLPTSKPAALLFNYRRDGTETYRLMLKKSIWYAGIKYAPGSGMGLATALDTKTLKGRIEYLRGWTLEGWGRMWIFEAGGYLSQTDSTFIGGASSIAGYPEDAIRTPRYLYMKAEIPLMQNAFIFAQPHWLNGSHTRISFGGGFQNENVKVFIAKAGGDPPTLHILIRN